MEIGPFRLDPAGGNKLLELDGAWNEYANVLFSTSSIRPSDLPMDNRSRPTLQLISPSVQVTPMYPRLTNTFMSYNLFVLAHCLTSMTTIDAFSARRQTNWSIFCSVFTLSFRSLHRMT